MNMQQSKIGNFVQSLSIFCIFLQFLNQEFQLVLAQILTLESGKVFDSAGPLGLNKMSWWLWFNFRHMLGLWLQIHIPGMGYGLKHPLFFHYFLHDKDIIHYLISLLVNSGCFQLTSTVSTTVLVVELMAIKHGHCIVSCSDWQPLGDVFLILGTDGRALLCVNIIWDFQHYLYWHFTN